MTGDLPLKAAEAGTELSQKDFADTKVLEASRNAVVDAAGVGGGLWLRLRTRYFERNELSRLCMDALRAADGSLLSTDAIAGRIIEAKGFDAADAALRKAIGEQALALLRSFRKRGTVEQLGLGRGVRWKMANGA